MTLPKIRQSAKPSVLLLEYAIRAPASDVHIEPREEFIQVRYRIDGVLQEANRCQQMS